MRVFLRRWAQAISMVALLSTAGACSSSGEPEEIDEFAAEASEEVAAEGDFAELDTDANAGFEDNNFSNFDTGGNEVAVDNFANDGFENFAAEGGDNFANDGFGNFAAEGGDNFANDGFGDDALGNDGFANNNFDTDSNNALAGGEGELQEIIEELNETGFDDTTTSNAAPVMEQAPMASMGAAPGLPELGSKMHYIVQPGDSLAKIAQRVYGDASRWTEIANFTGIANPRLIYPGDVVYYQLTEQSMSFASAYESVSRAEVVVQEGDTLSMIAGRVLGNPANWRSIWRENDNIENPDRLEAGTTLYYVEPGSLMAAMDSFKQILNIQTEEKLAESSEMDSNTDFNTQKMADEPAMNLANDIVSHI